MIATTNVREKLNNIEGKYMGSWATSSTVPRRPTSTSDAWAVTIAAAPGAVT